MLTHQSNVTAIDLNCHLGQGSPALRQWTDTGSRPVENWAMQEAGERTKLNLCMCGIGFIMQTHPVPPPYSTLPPTHAAKNGGDC